MSYVQGFLAPVPTERRDEFIAHAQKAATIFKEYGALQVRECWADDVPDGTHTSFPMAVKLEDGETVVFSWIEWPDKETAKACHASMDKDERWRDMGDMPFDGKRLMWGGFIPVVDA